MPRFGTPENMTMAAITTLVKLYKTEPDFVRELHQVVQLHQPAIKHFTLQWIQSHQKAVILPKNKYDNLVSSLARSLIDIPAESLDPDPCILALEALAWRWKLRLPKPLAGFMLFVSEMAEEVQSLGIVLEAGPTFHPYSQVKPLRLSISDWQIIEKSQDEIVKLIRTAVTKYTNELQADGLHDYPSSLGKHAQWWFKHYVKGKKYDEIAQEEAYSPGGSLISYSKNVGAAVRKISKLLAIKPEDLR